MNDFIDCKLTEIRQLAERMLSIAGGSRSAMATCSQSGSEPVFQFGGELAPLSVRDDNPATQLEADLPRLIATAKALYRLRQRRDPVLGFEVCKEPHWDIVLDLFINRAVGRRVSITSACIASHRPVTTALRWLDYLEEKGVVQKVPCQLDNRKTYVELTLPTYAKMLVYLNEVTLAFVSLGAPPISPQFPVAQG